MCGPDSPFKFLLPRVGPLLSQQTHGIQSLTSLFTEWHLQALLWAPVHAA